MANAALITAGSRILASIIQSVAPLAAIKGADESVTSSTVLQNDNELFVPLAANAAYLFRCYLDYEAENANNAFQWAWSGPAGYSLRYTASYLAGGTLLGARTITGSTTKTSDGLGAGALMAADMTDGTIVTGATAGNLQLQWSQAISNAVPAIVHAQSLLALWRIS